MREVSRERMTVSASTMHDAPHVSFDHARRASHVTMFTLQLLHLLFYHGVADGTLYTFTPLHHYTITPLHHYTFTEQSRRRSMGVHGGIDPGLCGFIPRADHSLPQRDREVNHCHTNWPYQCLFFCIALFVTSEHSLDRSNHRSRRRPHPRPHPRPRPH